MSCVFCLMTFDCLYQYFIHITMDVGGCCITTTSQDTICKVCHPPRVYVSIQLKAFLLILLMKLEHHRVEIILSLSLLNTAVDTGLVSISLTFSSPDM